MQSSSVNKNRNNSNQTRETRLLNYKLILRKREKQKFRKKLKKEQQHKESSRRIRWKKPSVLHRSKTTDRKMPRRLKPIFSTRFHKRKRENRRLLIEVLVLQK